MHLAGIFTRILFNFNCFSLVETAVECEGEIIKKYRIFCSSRDAGLVVYYFLFCFSLYLQHVPLRTDKVQDGVETPKVAHKAAELKLIWKKNSRPFHLLKHQSVFYSVFIAFVVIATTEIYHFKDLAFTVHMKQSGDRLTGRQRSLRIRVLLLPLGYDLTSIVV